MSMTREEARIELQAMKDTFEEYEPGGLRCQMALKVALSALRPVSREQVEQMRGKFLIIRDVTVGERGELLFDAPSCSRCGHTITDICNFCPSCGAPMTDEAVEIVMERMEALHETV